MSNNVLDHFSNEFLRELVFSYVSESKGFRDYLEEYEAKSKWKVGDYFYTAGDCSSVIYRIKRLGMNGKCIADKCHIYSRDTQNLGEETRKVIFHMSDIDQNMIFHKEKMVRFKDVWVYSENGENKFYLLFDTEVIQACLKKGIFSYCRRLDWEVEMNNFKLGDGSERDRNFEKMTMFI